MFPVIDRTRRRKQMVRPCGELPIVAPSCRARAERHELLVMENSDGDRAEFTTPSIDDSVDELPVVMLGNGEYRRAIHADGIGALWRDMLILAGIVVVFALFVWATGGAV